MYNKLCNYQILAENFLIDGELSKAYRAFEKAYSFSKDIDERIDILFEMADLLWQMGKIKEAKKTYERILCVCEEPGAYYALGILSEDEDEYYSSSIHYFQKAIDLDPKYEQAYYYQALLWDKLGDREKAKELLYQCIILEPNDYIIYSDLSSIYEEEGKLEKAEKFVKKSLDIYPLYDKALYNLGVIQQRKGQFNLALESYKKAIESNSYDPAYYLNMSAIYLDRGDLMESLKILTAGIQKKLNSVNLFYNRACTYSRLGNEENAILDLREAININPDALLWARRDQDLLEISKEIPS